jgi:hypothetical protein
MAIARPRRERGKKELLCLVSAVLTMTAQPGIRLADDKREEEPRFKGVELYSWKDQENHWAFAMLDGTDRNKTEAEVKAAKNPIKGAEDLKEALARLAVGEHVFWTHRIEGFEFPPEAMQKQGRITMRTLWWDGGMVRGPNFW